MKKLLIVLFLLMSVVQAQNYKVQVAGRDTITGAIVNTTNPYKWHCLTYFVGSINSIAQYAVKFTITANDTIEFCSDSTFSKTVGSSNVFELVSGETYISPEYSVSYGSSFQNLYWRRKVISGETGSPVIRFIISGY